QTDGHPATWPEVCDGLNRWRCVIPPGLLNGGMFYVCPRISMHNMYWIVMLGSVVRFEVVLDHGVSPLWNSLDSRSRPRFIAPIFAWRPAPDEASKRSATDGAAPT